MSLALFHRNGPLPLNEETADTLIEAVEEKRLVALAKKHPLSPDHLLLKNQNGTSALLRAVARGRLDEVAAALATSGQHLTLAHFLTNDKRLIGRRNFLQMAVEYGHLDQVAAAIKPGGESLRLSHFLQKDFDGYNSLHVAAESGTLYQLAEILKASGESLTAEHFSIPATSDRSTPLHEAFVYGHLDQAHDVLKFFGAHFTHEQFLQKDAVGWNLLQIAIGNECLESLFKPAYWARHLGEIEKLWEQVPEREKWQVNYPALRNQVILQSIHAPQNLTSDDFTEAKRAHSAQPELITILDRGRGV